MALDNDNDSVFVNLRAWCGSEVLSCFARVQEYMFWSVCRENRARCIREIIGRGLGKKNTDCVSVEMMISQDT